MPAYRSRTTTHGRNMAGARGLWRATGMKDGDFGKPIIAVANSFTQFVPGHVHLKDLGQLVAREIEAAGGVAKEFNTIAVDDGIAMGHDGMLYSPALARAHRRQRRVHGQRPLRRRAGLHLQLRQDHARHADGGAAPQHPRRVRLRRADGGRQGRAASGKVKTVDLIDAMVAAADDKRQRRGRQGDRALRLPDLRLVLRHVHRQFDELPDRGARPVAARQRHDARHPRRPQAPVPRGRPPHRRPRPPLLRAGRRQRAAALDRHLRGLRERHDARHRHGRLDQHRAAPARRRARGRGATSPWPTSTGCRAACRACARSRPRWPTSMSRTCTAPAASSASSASSTAPACSTATWPTVHAPTLGDALDRWDIARDQQRRRCATFFRAAPGRRADAGRLQPGRALRQRSTSTAQTGVHPRRRRTPSPRTAAWPCSTATSPRTAAS